MQPIGNLGQTAVSWTDPGAALTYTRGCFEPCRELETILNKAVRKPHFAPHLCCKVHETWREEEFGGDTHKSVCAHMAGMLVAAEASLEIVLLIKIQFSFRNLESFDVITQHTVHETCWQQPA